MSDLSEESLALLKENGVLDQTLPQFRERAEQLQMAQAVAETITNGGCLVVEAGTGIGKTFAYLVPALLSDKRVVISTATKALQDQLVHRDLPQLQEILAKHCAVHRRVAALKGRVNYLCLHRLSQAERVDELEPVRAWAHATRHGDLAELGAMLPAPHLVGQITSTRENCLRGECPEYAACHVFRARSRALAADVAVVNHHLFFADLAASPDALPPLLAQSQVVVFDEAHALNSVGQQAFGLEFSTRQLTAFAQDLVRIGQHDAPGWRDWGALAMDMLNGARMLLDCCANLPLASRIAWEWSAPDGVNAAEWQTAWTALGESLRAVLGELDALTSVSAELLGLHQRAVALLQALMVLGASAGEEGRVRWLSCSQDGVQLSQTPFQSGADLQRLWALAQPAEKHEESSAWDEADTTVDEETTVTRSFIFTSATLGTNDSLDWFTEPLGLQQATTLRIKSPFDYAEQAALYIPDHLPAPNDGEHAFALAQWLVEPLLQLGGRALVLTTSLRAMAVVARVLRERLADHPQIELLVQGDLPANVIAQRFQASANETMNAARLRAGCVLVASHSYWQGFDVPGDALQIVVIDKLPFPVPTDPLVAAFEQHLEAQGRNAFKEFTLQEAAMALRQGAGRLIRGETDSGLLVVADARLAKGYGKWLQRQLPPMRRLASEEEFQMEVERLAGTTKKSGELEESGITRTSTKDHPSSQSPT